MNRYAYPLSFGVAAALTYLFLMSPIWYLTILAGLLSALPLYGKPIPVALCSMAGSAVGGLAGYLYPPSYRMAWAGRWLWWVPLLAYPVVSSLHWSSC